MSSRNAYQITVNKNNQRLYDRLKQKLNDLFCGHVEETSYGFYAEDSPGVSSAFENGPAGYIRPKDLQRELNQPAYEDADWDTFLEHQEQHDLDAHSPDQTQPYTTIITSVTHEYQNDTSGAREENQISL